MKFSPFQIFLEIFCPSKFDIKLLKKQFTRSKEKNQEQNTKSKPNKLESLEVAIYIICLTLFYYSIK